MTNNDELAQLKQLATFMTERFSMNPVSCKILNEDWKKRFPDDAAVAETLVALLAERDADKKRIAEQQEHISSLDEGVNMLLAQYDQLASAIGWTTEKALAGEGNQDQYAEAMVKRIAELEEMADLQRDKIKRLESDLWDEQQLRKVHSEKSFELENENRELKQRNDKDFIWRGKEIGRLNDEVDALKEKFAAAGIKLEVGE